MFETKGSYRNRFVSSGMSQKKQFNIPKMESPNLCITILFDILATVIQRNVFYKFDVIISYSIHSFSLYQDSSMIIPYEKTVWTMF